ncbi:MAG: GNAT family N-acetyltransferase [Alphaproteobacteria bacterium]|nr:GNAT family N-acetyltransferase [Alphaproteobacteria bacterium]MBV9419899.1 GNAT family N-acetyltransferase [Alphaproteobacteria bacterium]MBV9539903.1 GNAT family N-acetyltransferase [Alphaproteobacteria bacterium]MBV9905740.1 GNAT family N-acetyltransferase [Alphaproteobacteria bacterium]
MSFHPTTQRLILRAPTMTDIGPVVRLIGEYDVAKNLQRVPHPYDETAFREFLALNDQQRRDGTDFYFAITRVMDGALIGMCSVHAEEGGLWRLGYWIGKPYWGQGYATEAARPVMRFAFDDLGAERLTAGWFDDNPASGAVLHKVGFIVTGTTRVKSVARGTEVLSNRVLLTREQYMRKKAA